MSVSGPALGPYHLIRTIGEGEFGKVKLATHSQTGREVAIKLCKKSQVIATPNGYTKLMREISTLKMVKSHPYIISLIEVIETDAYIAIVMELAKGGELFEHILTNRCLNEDESRKLFAQIICAVGFIHSIGIVHRDLKLENILLDGEQNVLVTDFGFANRSLGPDGFLRTSCGSPCYAAPELVTSDGYVGESADIWSCGVILFSMIAGYLPYDDDPENPDGDNINLLYNYILETKLEYPDHVPIDCQKLINRILVPDPQYRANMDEIMGHVWLAPVRHYFQEEIERRKVTFIAI
ncbi:kinase-like domain-containing protein [Obelidium mucronatum]|nr:kinase-like domain-containing protein [Obelidium mucronatum]